MSVHSLPRDAVILQLPLRHEAIAQVQGRQLLRFLMLCNHVETLRYYVCIALEHVKVVAPNIPAQCLKSVYSLKQSSNVNRLRFGLLMMLNCSTNFAQWVATYSTLDGELMNTFCRLLNTHFRLLIECSNSQGKPALTPKDVVYPDLDTFVAGLVRLFVRLQ